MPRGQNQAAAEYRRKAEEARRQAEAAGSRDPLLRDKWLEIARQYDALAASAERQFPSGH